MCSGRSGVVFLFGLLSFPFLFLMVSLLRKNLSDNLPPFKQDLNPFLSVSHVQFHGKSE